MASSSSRSRLSAEMLSLACEAIADAHRRGLAPQVTVLWRDRGAGGRGVESVCRVVRADDSTVTFAWPDADPRREVVASFPQEDVDYFFIRMRRRTRAGADDFVVEASPRAPGQATPTPSAFASAASTPAVAAASARSSRPPSPLPVACRLVRVFTPQIFALAILAAVLKSIASSSLCHHA